jgi:BMFP domain-containing protein YqiC
VEGEVNIRGAQLGSPSGTLAEALSQAVSQTEAVLLRLRYQYASGDDKFSLDTNLLSIVNAALRSAAERYARQAAEEIERVVRNYAAQHLEGTIVSKEELDALFALAKGDKSALDTLRASLDQKKTEIERSLTNAAEEAANKAAQEAEAAARRAAEQAEEAARQAAGNALESLNLPRIPGFR